MRRTLLAAVLVTAGGALAGCSSSVAQGDVEDQIVSQLGTQLDEEPDSASCPGDLNAEVGETMTCTLALNGLEKDVDVEVTAVEGGDASFDLELQDYVVKGEVETQVAAQLGQEVGEEPDEVTCPTGLDATVGAALTCTLTAAGDEADVDVEVTEVEGSDVAFDIEVAGSVDRADVEEQVSTQLGAQVGREPEDITCPGDLPAVVGATLSCVLTDGGDQLDVALEVTGVDGADVSFDIEVGEQTS